MMPDQPLPARTLIAESLACRRGERLLFSDIGFSVRPGTALLLRGANGAGKTSLLMILAGIVPASAGMARIDGRGEEDGPDLGLLFYRSGLKPRLRVGETLRFWALLDGGAPEAIPGALALVGLAGFETLDTGFLSSGQQKRLALARLVLADRPVWLLDEPTAALDAEGEALVGRLIDRQLDRGGVVVAATHHDLGLSDASRVQTLVLGGAA